jgi:integrase/recombinase XerD
MELFFAEKGFSSKTEEQYRAILKAFLERVDIESCTAIDLLSFLRSTGWGNSRQYVACGIIRQFVKWKIGDHPVLRVRIKREKTRPGRTLNEHQIRELFASFDLTTSKGCRDFAIASLALDTGLRVNEIVTINMKDLALEKREILVRVKGGRWERVFFSPLTKDALQKWIEYRNPQDERLFQVTRDGLRVIIRRWGEKIGIKLSPHDFRRTFAVMAIKAGAPSRLVQVAGRWSDIRMVEYYTRTIEAVDLGQYFPMVNLSVPMSQ